MEQSAAVWSSSLTQKNIKDLERVQKSAVRIIIGKSYESYTETLKELDMKRLSERRDLICLKFAKTSLRLDNFKKLFPMQKNIHDMETRQNERYHVVRSYGKRYAVSAIPSMQKLLNKEHKKKKEALKSLVTHKLCHVGPINEIINLNSKFSCATTPPHHHVIRCNHLNLIMMQQV